MTKCKRCDRATEMFVCKTCVAELRKQLADLPYWIDRLAETAIGQAHLGDGGKRTTRTVLHGDDSHHDYPIVSDGNSSVPAYRYVYERLRKPIPDGKTLRHTCPAAACVNPNHMEIRKG